MRGSRRIAVLGVAAGLAAATASAPLTQADESTRSPAAAVGAADLKLGSGNTPLVPHRVHPGTRTRVRGSGFPPSQEVHARVSPIQCPTAHGCIKIIRGGRQTWPVDASGHVVARFRWPKTYRGYDSSTTFRRYRWKGGEKVKIELCTVRHDPHCIAAQAHIARSYGP